MINGYEPFEEKMLYLSDGSEGGGNSALQYLFGAGSPAGDTTAKDGGVAAAEASHEFDALIVQWQHVMLTATGLVALTIDRPLFDTKGPVTSGPDVAALRTQVSVAGTIEDSAAQPPTLVFRRGRRVYLRALGATYASNSSVAVCKVTFLKRVRR